MTCRIKLNFLQGTEMTNHLEDLLGKILIAVVFFGLTGVQFLSVVAMLADPWSFDGWLLAFLSRALSLNFLLLVVYLTLTRFPPVDSAQGIEPRISALVGTFALMLLVVLPTGSVGPAWRLFATILIVVGSALSIYAISFLGRSFSIMATARELVQTGPYSVVRHPLYLAEAISIIGIIISNWSVAALILGTIQFGFQFRRMHNEERVLRRNFPEYRAYSERVPMIVPFSR